MGTKKLKLDTAGRRVNVGFLMQPGEEIEVSEERADELTRRYGQLRRADAKPEPKGAREVDGLDAQVVPAKRQVAPAKRRATKKAKAK